jgi:hypothetical protein
MMGAKRARSDFQPFHALCQKEEKNSSTSLFLEDP